MQKISGSLFHKLAHYAEKAVASEDENIKTNAGTVISICLDINEELGSQLKEEGTMNETIRRIFKKDFDAVEQKTNERVATDMLKKNLHLSLIEEISKLSEDTIRSLAKNIGVAVL